MRLQIEKAVYGGAGLACQTEGEGAGRTVFVPFTLPGEVVEAKLTGEKNGLVEASLIQMVQPSANRIEPACVHFGECGGCHYQHANYAAQVAIKAEILRETLQRAGLNAFPEIQRHSAEPWGYRNRAQLRVAVQDQGVRLGYNRRGTNEFLAIRECPILAPLLWRGAEALVQLAAENSAAGRCAREVKEVELFTDADEKTLQMTLFVQKDQPGFNGFCQRMKELLPELAGAGLSLLSSQGTHRRAQKSRQMQSWGPGGLGYRAAGESYWVSRSGFFQVNRFLVDELIRVVTTGREGRLAWDLYAGVGLFSRVLARKFQQVVAVEAAGSDLAKSFKGAGRQAVESTTVEFLRGAVVQRARPDLVVMDPPRAGIGAEGCALLSKISAPEMVYVSCDPVTLAWDLKMMTEAGYSIVEVHMIDLFPQTFHLESVVVLRTPS
jgi:23S rRNA (uracil1939-C5)-methyltransferase